MGRDRTRWRPSWPRPPAPAPAGRRVTPFEIFFDLVFVFALTRIMSLIGRQSTPATMVQGLILLVLLWIAWSSYTWLGNQTRAEVGMVRLGFLVAMAALFVAALAMPEAWTSGPGLDGPLLVALAYVLLRVVHLGLYYWAAAGVPGLRPRIRFFAAVSAAGWVPLLLGALLSGTAHAVLWVVAFVVEIGGQRLSYARRGTWPLRSASHFTERHGLVLIIALGESLVAAGVGAASAVTRPPVLGVALVGFAVTSCLWWLYFDRAGPAAARVLATATGERRDRIASDAYSQTHLLLIIGVIYLSLGVEQVLALVAGGHGEAHDEGATTTWSASVALYGGAALFLGGRLLFLRLTGQPAPPAQRAVVVLVLLLLPLGVLLPPAAALGVLGVVLLTAVAVERLSGRRRTTAGAPPPEGG
ncbi:low temperature requirement protein A [Micromonospora terminaliae]|uniref:Low temperature requirement protein A n=1 Tax=Micromonospora terminaliae TaxID=1914461 RepID=A0AAJ3DIA8_9ACTN|nr:low temperature requirement protein A [Micromonospora terminaliae]NES27542.1 low temperature requirement protein A [Micromonospora terminaliae]QGL47725.1 low temperature requirement protein A [Micromonospora terminaliae]